MLAGFSAGGVHAASFALRREIRALGFIAVAPYIREAYLEFMTERLASFPMAGLRGWVVAGEDDPVALAGARSLVDALGRAAVPVRLSVRHRLAHEYPHDFSAELREALRFVAP